MKHAFRIFAIAMILALMVSVGGTPSQVALADNGTPPNGNGFQSHLMTPRLPITIGAGWACGDSTSPPLFGVDAVNLFNNEGPFTFTSLTPVEVKVTDAFLSGDQFRIYDNAVSIGDTSSPTLTGAWTDCPDTAFADVNFSHGTFLLGPGSHSITIQSIDAPYGSGGGYIRVDSVAPDLVVTKTNDVSGSVAYPNTWHWAIKVQNNGTADAVFADGQRIMLDNLPSGATYSWYSFATIGAGVTAGFGFLTYPISGPDVYVDISGGSVTIKPGEYLEIRYAATPSVAGTYANPRAGGVCTADPNGVIAESNEGNNDCSDSVTVTAPAVGLNPTSLDFGYQELGTTSAAQNVLLTNTGTADLHIGLLSYTSDWTVTNDTCTNATVAPTATCTFDVVFNPHATGPLTGSVHIPSDAATSEDIVNLSGNGYMVSSMAFASDGKTDGHMTESRQNSGLGGSSSASGGYIQIGDASANRQVKGLLSFNTSSLPAGAVILGGHIELRYLGQVGDNPFGWAGYLRMDIASQFGSSLKVKPEDFQATPAAFDVADCGSTAVSSWYTCDLVSGFDAINPLGFTQFRMYFDFANNGDKRADYVKIASGNSPNKSYYPVLVVDYYVP